MDYNTQIANIIANLKLQDYINYTLEELRSGQPQNRNHKSISAGLGVRPYPYYIDSPIGAL